MKILDPIHKYIYFSSEETQLIDAPAFQRLRNIKQLGFTERSFPSAVHNRLTHSLGACHLAGLAFKNIFSGQSPLSEKKEKEFYQLVRLTALLHDIGHGPLSHSSEPLMPPLNQLFPSSKKIRKSGHEDYSVLLIQESSIANILNRIGVLPEHIMALIRPDEAPSCSSYFTDQGVNYRPLLEQLIHSEIDVDRMDYLKRDSYFCGAYYGHLDFDWILKNLSFHIEKDQAHLAIKSPALYTIEDFLLGHHHIHLAVYFHHKNIIYDEMLLKYFNDPLCRFCFPAKSSEYISFHDSSLYSALEKDKTKISWAKRITDNDPYKKLFQIQHTPSQSAEAKQKISKITRRLKESSVDFIEKRVTSHIAKTFKESLSLQIYVIEPYSKKVKTLEESVRLFKNHDRVIHIDRIYVEKDKLPPAWKLIKDIL